MVGAGLLSGKGWKGLAGSWSGGMIPAAFDLMAHPFMPQKYLGFAASPFRGLKSGYDMSLRGTAILNVPLAAFSMATAPRGHALSAGAESLSMGIGGLLGGVMFGPAGAIAGGILADTGASRAVGKAFQALHDLDRNLHRLHMGGDYQDSEQAYTMRQAAVQEMSGSLLNARAWLGREGRAMHA